MLRRCDVPDPWPSAWPRSCLLGAARPVRGDDDGDDARRRRRPPPRPPTKTTTTTVVEDEDDHHDGHRRGRPRHRAVRPEHADHARGARPRGLRRPRLHAVAGPEPVRLRHRRRAHPAQVLVGATSATAPSSSSRRSGSTDTPSKAQARRCAGRPRGPSARPRTAPRSPRRSTSPPTSSTPSRPSSSAPAPGDLNVVVVAALLSDAVISFNFAGASARRRSRRRAPPIEVAAFGLGKIKAASQEQLEGD